MLPPSFAPRTIYVGGGTPTALGAGAVSRLCHMLRAALKIGENEIDAHESATGPHANETETAHPLEWTVEANPDTLDREMADALRGSGVSRLSIGAQSFDPATLALLGRSHTPVAIERAVRVARSAGFDNLGLDLIAGVPGVSESQWRDTLDAALDLLPEHLSVYSLCIEPGTPFDHAVREGRLLLHSDDAQMDILELTEETLLRAGYERYEISNYAKPGFECSHNLAVWRGEDFLGLGPSAASRQGLRRATNQADVAAWESALLDGRAPPAEIEWLEEAEDARERFLTGLRLNEGVAPGKGSSPWSIIWARKLGGLVATGLVEGCGEGRWRLTRRGREVTDAVSAEFYVD